MLHMCLLTLSYIHKHTNEFHRLHERHITYVAMDTIIYNGKRFIYDCVQCVLCILYVHVYVLLCVQCVLYVIYAHDCVLVYMDGGRVLG